LIPLRTYIEANPKANRRQFVCLTLIKIRDDNANYLQCIDLARGVDFLHSNGFAHGRIRLSNMFVDPETGVSMLGMPSERSIPNGITLREYSKWASPELANSDTFRKMPVDHYRDAYRGEYRPDSDIYALACTIIEIYTGRTPGTYRINTVRDSLSGSGFMPGTVNTAAIPPDVVHTLMLMMNLDPGRRLNSGLVVQHLMNPRLVHVTNFQPALAKYQARRFMRSMSSRASNS
jgi:serine/threonine protein kinase